MTVIQGLIASISTSLTPSYNYSVTPTYTSVNEGVANDFVFSTDNPNIDRLYWSITDLVGTNMSMGRFNQSEGDNGVSVEFGGNTGDIIVSADSTTSPDAQGYTFRVYTDIGRNNEVASAVITVNDTSVPVPPFSLQFVESDNDYLDVAASADWNLGTTWTIEFWLNANAESSTAIGGIWGLLNQGGWSATNSIVVALSDNKLVFLSVANNANDDVRYTEPTPGQWTHVAIANNAGTQKVFYNGFEQTRVSGNVGTASYTNSTDALRIGRLSPPNGGTLNGKMAMVRVSNTAKYSAAFTPSVTYGVEADTKLFLSSDTPLVDSMLHAITNNGVTASTTFVNRYTATHSASNQGSSNVHIDSNPTNDAWAGNVPVGARIISSVTGRFTVNSIGRDGNNNWIFFIGAGPIGGFTAGETHTFIW